MFVNVLYFANVLQMLFYKLKLWNVNVNFIWDVKISHKKKSRNPQISNWNAVLKINSATNRRQRNFISQVHRLNERIDDGKKNRSPSICRLVDSSQPAQLAQRTKQSQSEHWSPINKYYIMMISGRHFFSVRHKHQTIPQTGTGKQMIQNLLYS